MDLDHVAIATHKVDEVLEFLVGKLGASVLFGGPNIGFKAMQVDPGDLRIELLEPHQVEINDFLERFLRDNGEGPHHLTFKTGDIERELDRASDAGYTPVGVNIANDFWREAFLHPKEAGGTVVQLAQSAIDPTQFLDQIRERVQQNPEDLPDMGVARWWPEPPEPSSSPARMRRVVVNTNDIGQAITLYQDFLGGKVEERGEGWLEVGWPSGGRVRLEQSGGRGGIDRLEWTHDGPATEHKVAGTRFVLHPDST